MKRIALLGLAAALCLATLAACASPKVATVQTITPEDARARLAADKSIVLVDVRTQAEYDAEHIAGALVAPVETLSTTAAMLLPDKNATTIIYCRSGNRSASAARILVNLGYKHVFDLGGINSWPYETVKP